MPTYEYKCSNGHQYETREGFDAPARQECTVCGAPAKRVIHPPPIVFKGSGFYITDSRKGSSATLGNDLGGAASSSSSDSNGSSDSKPAASTTTTSSDSSSSD